ncbi:GNAT family N-acetyltransferase, partial [Nocardia wallacei]|uniref:GNAT family N-acetyltransferase n=1 Tax=Nocardia wallacei TaxID=480035 RepID=UPI0024564FCE
PWRFESFSDPQCLRFSWPLTEPCTPAHVPRRFTPEEVARRAGTGQALAGARTVVHPLPFTDTPLSDGAVTPRPWRATDLPWRFESFSDPQCLRFSWPLTEPCTPEHVHRRFTDEEVARRAGTELALAVGSAADPEELLGSISLYDIEREHARAGRGHPRRPAPQPMGVRIP